MSHSWNSAGFGYSPDGRLAGWQTEEVGPMTGPERGGDEEEGCPLTYDLLEFTMGRMKDPARYAALEQHVVINRCPRCGPRYDAQRQAYEQMMAGYAATREEKPVVRLMPVYEAILPPVSIMNFDGPDAKPALIDVPITLRVSEEATALDVVLCWSRESKQRDGAAPWNVSLRLDRPKDEVGQTTWEGVANHEVELELLDEKQERPCLIQGLVLQENEQSDALFTYPEPTALDPTSVRHVHLTLGHRRPPTTYE